MNLYKAETGSVYGPVYAVASNYGDAERMILDSGREIRSMEVVRGAALFVAADHATEALIDELQSRIVELEATK